MREEFATYFPLVDLVRWLGGNPFIHEARIQGWLQHPVIQLITTTSKLGRFFQEVGRPIIQGERVSPPSPDEIQRFVKTAERYSYWLATPEENASLGISLF